MKKSYWFLIGIFALVISCLWFLFHGGEISTDKKSATSSPDADTQHIGAAKSDNEKEEKKKLEAELESVPEIPGHPLTLQDKFNLLQIAKVFGASIDFYGKVLDEKNQPVADAEVYYAAADKYFKDGSKYKGKSDSQGMFSITNIKGAGLYVEVSKEDYYRIPYKSYASFGYGMPSGKQPPSKSNPAIFYLRKRGDAEPMVYKEAVLYGFTPDGALYGIDLINGKKLAGGGGDMQISIKCDATVASGQKFNWSCVLEVPGGGLMESSEEFMFLAPEAGYQLKVEYFMDKEVTEWKGQLKRKFYIRTAKGCYARVEAQIIPDYNNKAVIDLMRCLNPSGSRNLEYDPKKRLKWDEGQGKLVPY